ncbi:hypothetical protein IW261DRAFT_1399486 [Armillaria novae-zelandiae]|uniref:Heterokaryon incompatibility domain-containing protein n=1 Tax=Armillaria novae-zelandiae TaxID=153914 RepID=A0AA39UAY6_9AGAR|nr:hypothetical protein IW261DRAFT_1399486 [Armillaria novae-zelandiae]
MNDGDVERKAQDEKSREEEMERKEKEWATRKPVEYPKVTISAFTETGREESSIVVPLQRIYTGREPVIPSILAGTPCATLGARGLLDHLNSTLGTSYGLDDPFLTSILVECMTNECDLGMAYGRLRRIWYIDDWSRARDVLWRWCGEDQKERREALVGNRIVKPYLPPRRLQPISHSWMDEKDRTAVWTPINGYKWPVPIPKDADLNLIRIEMLNLGEEYVWLDVLCLRQEGGRREDLHAEEWRLDVPTIGYVNVVCYLSGLGRPLMLNEGDLDSNRCWFRRAWMLQEIGDWREIAGDTPDGPMHAECKDEKYATELLTRFHTKLQDASDLESEWLEGALAEMRTRVSTNPVDKIAGLAFLMGSMWIPAYSESASLEHAWTALVHSMNAWFRGQFFFLCAEPGDGGPKWWPSWHQVMTKPLLPYEVLISVDRDETGGVDSCEVECVDGFMQGLAVVKEGDRQGEFIVECDDSILQFKITTPHTYPIPEDTYTLIWKESDDLDVISNVCVVGRSLPEGRFEKVSVVEAFDKDLMDITEKRQYILI